MTDATPTDEAIEAVETDETEPAQAAPEPGDGDAQADEPDAQDDRQSRDAAKYRRRLRETESERDTLAAQVEALQRAAIEAQAANEAIKPAALWASGVQLAELLTDNGTVDTEKVMAACTTARELLGLGPRGSNRVPGEGSHVAPPAGINGREGMLSVVMGREGD